jgi:hypothetical protein
MSSLAFSRCQSAPAPSGPADGSASTSTPASTPAHLQADVVASNHALAAAYGTANRATASFADQICADASPRDPDMARSGSRASRPSPAFMAARVLVTAVELRAPVVRELALCRVTEPFSSSSLEPRWYDLSLVDFLGELGFFFQAAVGEYAGCGGVRDPGRRMNTILIVGAMAVSPEPSSTVIAVGRIGRLLTPPQRRRRSRSRAPHRARTPAPFTPASPQ